MKGFNFLAVPLAIVAFIVVTFFANAVMFTAGEKTVIYALSLIVITLFVALSFK
jgi:uncharacterized membrane protein